MATETLRPNAAGEETTLIPEPAGNYNWQNVDGVEPEDYDYNYTYNTAYLRDLYNLPASTGLGIINFIKIYIRIATVDADETAYARPALRTNSTTTDGTEVSKTGTTDYETFSEQWNTNPANGQPWEWADIDALQIGVSLKSVDYAKCSQVYVEVDYTPAAPPGLENKSGNIAAKMVAAGLI
jgi:hypothetical protein